MVGTDPQRRLDDALRRFKQILETGEVVRSDGSPEGTDATAATQPAGRPSPLGQPIAVDREEESPCERTAGWAATRVEVQDVPDPKILNSRDAIVKVTSTAICGSDLHLYDGYIPTMEKGDILGHEFMGEVVELGPGVSNLAVGDRVVVPFPIACGACNSCDGRLLLACARTPTPTRAWPRSCGATPAPACSATPT